MSAFTPTMKPSSLVHMDDQPTLHIADGYPWGTTAHHADCPELAQLAKAGIPSTEIPWAERGGAWLCTCIDVAGLPSERIDGDTIDAPERHDGEGRGQAKRTGPSPAQERFIRTLIAERSTEDTLPDLIIAMANAADTTARKVVTSDLDAFIASLGGREASSVIDFLKATPIPTAEGKPARTNRYAGTCVDCGQTVDAEAGSLTSEGGKWVTRHFPACPATPEAHETPRVAAPAAIPEPGVYVVGETVYRVQKGRQGGRLYALELHDDGTEDYRGQRPFAEIAADGRALTAAEAAEWGHRTGACVFCARKLTDDRSLTVGYGPTCSKKAGLPWG